MDAVLELAGVSKQFPGHLAVDDVSFTVPRGSLFTLVGPSGCGKTSVLRMIAGFEQPTQGELKLNGGRIEHLRPYERNVSTVFQSYALFPHLTVRENIEFGLRRKGAQEMEGPVAEVMALLRLAGKEQRYPHQMSGGERQRVALARSLVLKPELLLLDEPLSALDPQLRKQVRVELKSLQRSVGITFLMVTHDQEEALSLSDSIAVMNRGRLEQVGTPEQIYLQPASRFVASFLGAVNWVGEVGVRPEMTRLASEAPGGGACCHRGTIRSATFLGNCVHVHVDLAGGGSMVVAEIPRNHFEARQGQAVWVWWNSADEIHLPERAA